MEAWLTELEMEASYKEHQLTVAATLGEDFPIIPHPPHAAGNSAAASSQGEFSCNAVMETHHLSDSCGNGNNIYSNDNDNDNDNDNKVDKIVNSYVDGPESHQQNKKEAVSVGTKRKRLPHKVQDHIIAERKRRELITQMFISLSTIVPGLKKVDKTTVLTETIKYVKQLQEKVKVLEEKADEKKVIESMVVMVKTRKITVDNDNDNDSSSAMGDNCAGGSGGCNSNNGDGNNDEKDTINLSSLPEIEVKKLGETLLLKVCCAKLKWILPKLYAELYKHDLSITHSNVTPFESLAIITIIAQIGRNFNKNVKDFVKTLCTTLREPVTVN